MEEMAPATVEVVNRVLFLEENGQNITDKGRSFHQKVDYRWSIGSTAANMEDGECSQTARTTILMEMRFPLKKVHQLVMSTLSWKEIIL